MEKKELIVIGILILISFAVGRLSKREITNYVPFTPGFNVGQPYQIGGIDYRVKSVESKLYGTGDDLIPDYSEVEITFTSN